MNIEKFLNFHGLQTLISNLKLLFATKNVATHTSNGLMSADDKKALDLIISKGLDGGTASTLETDFLNECDGGSAVG